MDAKLIPENFKNFKKYFFIERKESWYSSELILITKDYSTQNHATKILKVGIFFFKIKMISLKIQVNVGMHRSIIRLQKLVHPFYWSDHGSYGVIVDFPVVAHMCPDWHTLTG